MLSKGVQEGLRKVEREEEKMSGPKGGVAAFVSLAISIDLAPSPVHFTLSVQLKLVGISPI